MSTLVENKSKYIVLLKVSRKSQDVKDEILNWLNEQVKLASKQWPLTKENNFLNGNKLNKKATYLLRFTLVIQEHQDKED